MIKHFNTAGPVVIGDHYTVPPLTRLDWDDLQSLIATNSLSRKRTDLFLEWPIDEAQGYFGPVQRVVIELKILHKGLEKTLQDGLAQTADYADRCGADDAHLIIFNRDPAVDWDDKIWHRSEASQGRAIEVWGA